MAEPAAAAPGPAPGKPADEGSSSDGETASPAEKRVLGAFDRVLDEWFVVGLHRAGARKFIKDRVANATNADCGRLQQWLLLRMNGRAWKHGLPLRCHAAENVPGLRSYHVWPRGDLPWLSELESRHAEILSELMASRGGGGGAPSGFQPYRDPVTSGSDAVAADGIGVEGVDRGMWNVLYFFLNHKKFEDNCERFPATIRAIQDVFPRHYSHAFFSALTPGSHIMKHFGPSNRMLRVWLPVCGLEGFRLRVGDTIVEPRAGEAFAWDHSFEHEAWHEGTETRVVLIVDIWHPDLTAPEVQFFKMLQNCRLRAGRALAAETEDQRSKPEDISYFEIVERARSLLTDDDWWVLNAERDPTTRPT